MHMLKKPEWRDAHSLMETLNEESVTEKILEKIVEKRENYLTNGEVFKSVKEDANEFIPDTIKDIRYYDIRESKYWIIMFFPVIIFLLFEMFTLLQNPNLASIPSVRIFILLSMILVSFTFILLLLALSNVYSRKTSKILPTNLLISWNVVVTALGIFFIHYILVLNSGGTHSPFFSALTFAALTIIGLPRENNLIVYSISGLSFICISALFFINKNVDTSLWNSYQCPIAIINISVLLISIIISIALRGCSSRKITNPKNDEK